MHVQNVSHLDQRGANHPDSRIIDPVQNTPYRSVRSAFTRGLEKVVREELEMNPFPHVPPNPTSLHLTHYLQGARLTTQQPRSLPCVHDLRELDPVLPRPHGPFRLMSKSRRGADRSSSMHPTNSTSLQITRLNQLEPLARRLPKSRNGDGSSRQRTPGSARSDALLTCGPHWQRTCSNTLDR